MSNNNNDTKKEWSTGRCYHVEYSKSKKPQSLQTERFHLQRGRSVAAYGDGGGWGEMGVTIQA